MLEGFHKSLNGWCTRGVEEANTGSKSGCLVSTFCIHQDHSRALHEQDSAVAFQRREGEMAVYKVIELVGTSTDSWEKAAAAAVEAASKSLRDLRIAEISELDLQLEGGKVRAYRAKVKVSFKYEGGD